MSSADLGSLKSALEAYDAGRAAEAEPMLRALAAKYPGNYQANEALGSLLAEADDLQHALSYLEHAASLAPREALAHANLGAAYLKLARTDAAVRELRAAIALEPANIAAQSNLGQALMLQNQPGPAAKVYAEALAASPTDAELRYDYALALYNSGAFAQASDALGGLPAAAETERVHLLAGDANEHAGRFQAALLHFQAAAKLNPSDDNLYALTVELLRHWNWPEAIAVADYGTKRYPASQHFRMAAGIAFYGKGDYKEAVQVFSGLLQTEPQNATVADLLGRSCSLLADGEDAGCSGVYAYAMQHPGNPILTTYAAVSILHAAKDKQDLDGAATLLESAIHADPKYPEAYFQLGVLEQRRLHWQGSADALEKAVALRPTSPEAHYRLSRVYSHLGRPQDAERELALHQRYAAEAKQSLDARLQEVMRFVLKPS